MSTSTRRYATAVVVGTALHLAVTRFLVAMVEHAPTAIRRGARQS